MPCLPSHRVTPPNYRGFPRWFAVLSRVWQTWGRAGACSRRLIIAMPCYITMPCYTAELSGIFTMVRRFIAGVCGSNGGSNADTVANAPPYTIDRLILWSYDRPPKTLSLFGWMSRAIRRPHMVSAARKIFARSFLCELPAFGSALPTCRAGACSRRVTPPRRCLPPLVDDRFALLLLLDVHFGFALR